MAKDRTVLIIAALGIFGVLLATGQLGFLGSVAGDQPAEDVDIPDELVGESSDLSLAAYDRTESSSTQVASTAYAYRDNGERIYLGSKSLSSSSRTTFSDYTITRDPTQYEAISFDSTYDYGLMVDGVVDAKKVLQNLHVYEGVGSGNIAATFFDENGESASGSVTVDGGETLAIDGVRHKVDASNKRWNPSIMGLKWSNSTDSNITDVSVTGADTVTCPSTISDYDACYQPYDPASFTDDRSTFESKTLASYESTDRVPLQITADSDGCQTNDEIFVVVKDQAPYQATDDSIEEGAEDDTSNPSDVGVGDAVHKLDCN